MRSTKATGISRQFRAQHPRAAYLYHLRQPGLRVDIFLLSDQHENIAKVVAAEQQLVYQHFSHESGATGDENVSAAVPLRH